MISVSVSPFARFIRRYHFGFLVGAFRLRLAAAFSRAWLSWLACERPSAWALRADALFLDSVAIPLDPCSAARLLGK